SPRLVGGTKHTWTRCTSLQSLAFQVAQLEALNLGGGRQVGAHVAAYWQRRISRWDRRNLRAALVANQAPTQTTRDPGFFARLYSRRTTRVSHSLSAAVWRAAVSCSPSWPLVARRGHGSGRRCAAPRLCLKPR